ncbi:hypothetical protein Taro_019199 [Colocasia esculenta]|uniref:Transposase n=1 Tax=Colocasia esculenta TaxID=4460 RepID=A0A843UW24_COLES|nr:hypothetical protein [Colocasia esculenta]
MSSMLPGISYRPHCLLPPSLRSGRLTSPTAWSPAARSRGGCAAVLTADWFSREEYEKFREDLQGKRIHIDAQSTSISKRKFDIPISLHDFVMKDLDQKWRSWKYDLRMKFFTPYQKVQQHFTCSDTRVVEDQWKNLVQIWSSEEFKDKIRDIKLTQQSSTSSSIASVGDAYEQVLGRDRTGRVRGIGTGPTAKSLWGSRSEQKLRQDNESLKQQIDALEERMKKIESRGNNEFVYCNLSWSKEKAS